MSEPIAIVGQSCVLPGALNADELWSAVQQGQNLISSVPAGYWRINPDAVLQNGSGSLPANERARTDRGGYVSGFGDIFNADGFAISKETILSLDTAFQWLLHSSRQALSSVASVAQLQHRTSVIFGNLSYPSHNLTQLAESIWLQSNQHLLNGQAAELAGIVQPAFQNRYMSGYPAHVVANALGLGGESFCLDAACASSLYALKLACDKLNSGQSDLVLAGGINCADDLFLHVGFSALQALSKSGQSLPFNNQADGLLPAEGVAVVALKRLADAEAQGDDILAVVRGVGLSNDGRSGSFLAPAMQGQVRAIKAAYQQSGLNPKDISLMECHATGTPVGDTEEIKSMSEVFKDNHDMPIGSLKSNMGHLITASGMAGLMKVIASMKAGVRPPTLNTETPIDILSSSPFRLLKEAEPWECNGLKRAGINNFGFGGNNAHCIVEEYQQTAEAYQPKITSGASSEIAIVGIDIIAGSADNIATFAQDVFLENRQTNPQIKSFELSLKGLKFPPMDLKKSLPQQTIMMSVARGAVADAGGLTGYEATTGTFIGMQCDAEIARFGVRWRMSEWAEKWSHSSQTEFDTQWSQQARDAAGPFLESAGVVDAMPNIPANRLNSQFDWGGYSFVTCSEELSGIVALNTAISALQNNELDVALVGAVDLSCEPVNQTAATHTLPVTRHQAGDAAVALILKRADDARKDNDKIYAIVSNDSQQSSNYQLGLDLDENSSYITQRFGHSHCTSGLLHITAAALACSSRIQPYWNSNSADENNYSTQVTIQSFSGQQSTIKLSGDAEHRTNLLTEKGISLATQNKQGAGNAPSLQFNAHYDNVQFPAKTTNLATASSSAEESMAPPPMLPSVMNQIPVMSTPVAVPNNQAEATQNVATSVVVQPQVQQTSQAGLQATSTTVAQQTVVVTGVDPVSDLLAQASAMHQNFIKQQSQLHQQFMSLQQQAWGQNTSNNMTPSVAENYPAESAVVSESPISQPTSQESINVPPPVMVEPAIAKPVVNQEITTSTTKQEVPSKPKETSTATQENNIDSTSKAPVPTGPKFSREDLEVLASGKISSVLGALFEQQDQYDIQVRMPEPPLLLADRVTGIKGDAGSMGTGTIWTETDVPKDAWYLHQGAVPPGIMIESGQADLLLISWLGADFLNKGERAYRLLGCELTYHEGGMPRPGDTLCYDIHVDGHAKHGDVRLFFFHYDCRVNDQLKLSVRQGQAGFFNTEELADSGGVLWSAEDDEPKENAQMAPSPVECKRTSFSKELVQAFAEGRAYECFGEGFEATAAHTRTPGIPTGKMKMWEEVTELSSRGGPWKRGYLKIETPITKDDWYFKGHFKNDPCMPGTLMADAAVQTMAFYMASQGFTLHRDGWHFEPMPDEAYKFVCRGQVLPHAKHLTYELYVEEIIGGDTPTIYGAMLCTCDGQKVFQCRRYGLRLVPNWPLTSMPELLEGHEAPRVVGESGDVCGDYSALLACAWGAPTAAFGQMYKRFDGPCTVPRLPGPPYHFMSKVLSVEGHPGKPEPGKKLISEYDVPPDAWYFNENGHAVMPFCVLCEVLLQPCGWFGSFMGFATRSDNDLCIRNLDGDSSKQLIELGRNFGTLRIEVTLTKLSQMGPMALVFFHVDSYKGNELVHTLNTSFGFFSQEALVTQLGLPVTDEIRELRDKESDYFVDLTEKPEKFCAGSLRIANPMLRMIDQLTGYWPEEGDAGLGRIRARQTVDPDAWYFKAHFFQDPVQPGSLGLEALLQLLQCYMIEKGLDAGLKEPRFEAIAMNEDMIWKYRGQVVPSKEFVTTELEITKVVRDENSIVAIAKGNLWCDGLRIYSVENMAMRITDGAFPKTTITSSQLKDADPTGESLKKILKSDICGEIVLHKDNSPWISDHCPTYTVPALPMMVMVDYLASAAHDGFPEMKVVGLQDVQVFRWVLIEESVRLKTEIKELDNNKLEVTLLLWRDADIEKLSRFEPAAKGIVTLAKNYAGNNNKLSNLESAKIAESSYESGALFHGPAFQIMKLLQIGKNGSAATLDAGAGQVPTGYLNPVLLDGATHAIPHDKLNQWFDAVQSDQVAYPHKISSISFHQATPLSGNVFCEVRAKTFEDNRHPIFQIQLSVDDKVWMEMELMEIMFPKGNLGNAPSEDRRTFLQEKGFVQDLGLSEVDGQWSKLSHQTVKMTNWLPGTLENVYQFSSKGSKLTQHIVTKEHFARQQNIHPSQVTIKGDSAYCQNMPLTEFPYKTFSNNDAVSVQNAGDPILNIDPVLSYWRDRLDATSAWPVEDIFFALIRRFVGKVYLTDPKKFYSIKGRSVLYLGNHQVGIESLLFSVIAGGLNHVPVVTVAKAEHKNTWLGRLIALCQNYPGKNLPKNIMFFERADQASMLKMLADIKESLVKEGLSLMVHSEGTRALHCGEPVKKLSSVFIDLAVAANLPIVPVRFSGGLPSTNAEDSSRFEFPIGYGRQDYYLGAPIMPEDLKKLTLAERTRLVLGALNTLGPDLEQEEPNNPNPDFASQVKALSKKMSMPPEYAAIFRTLKDDSRVSQQMQKFFDNAKSGRKLLSNNPEDSWLSSFGKWLGIK